MKQVGHNLGINKHHSSGAGSELNMGYCVLHGLNSFLALFQFSRQSIRDTGGGQSAPSSTSISCTTTTMAGQGRVASRIKAMDVVRRGVETLTSLGVVSFMCMQSEEGQELLGEEELNSKMFKILDERNIIELAQTIRMRGHQLNHSSTRHIKMIEM